MKFTREDYIAALALLDEVRAMLGPNGEHWVKDQFYGISHMHTYGSSEPFPKIGSIPPNCWCLHGAIAVRGPRPNPSTSIPTSPEMALGVALCEIAPTSDDNIWAMVEMHNDDQDTDWAEMQRWMGAAEARLKMKIAEFSTV